MTNLATTPPVAREARVSKEAGPRIYNLFPLLAGPIDRWSRHLPRIADMGFDWIYINPFHSAGFSGSLYAIKDPYRLHDLLAAQGERDPDQLLEQFVADAARHGQHVMMDLVVNHTSKDALLANEHPEWYRRNEDGSLYSPRAIEPTNPANVTVWGDLAELDLEDERHRDAQLEYWGRYLRHYLARGVRGFRCDAAYKVPASFWQQLITTARDTSPGVRFFAETLGCSAAKIVDLRPAGFDYLFNSSKWWDFRADWLLEQYRMFRTIAPTIAFPESHDTERLAMETGTNDPERIAQLAKMRYLFAACFSTGVMVPVGFEYGFRKRLDVVRTRPSDWEEPTIDISDFIAATNAMKRAVPALNEEGPQRRLSAPHADVLALMRETANHNDGCALVLINSDSVRSRSIDPGPLIAGTGGHYDRFEDVTPQASPLALDSDRPLLLDPFEVRVFRGERPHPHGSMADDKGYDAASAERLARLAQRRVVIEDVWPEIEGGRHPIKRVVGDVLEVWADIFCDGHDVIAAELRSKEAHAGAWHASAMAHFDNDRWRGEVPLLRNARYLYTIEAWRDLFATWRSDFVKKREAGQAVKLELVEGRSLVARAAENARGRDATALGTVLARIDAQSGDEAALAAILLGESVGELMRRAAPRTNLSRYEKELEVVVDRTAARFSTWYELFPRSTSGDARRHGRFDDVVRHLPYVRDMGFDVLYFPPIHPIGRTNCKGRNNSLIASPDDPGSPYAIGSAEGGHTTIHPELGAFEDFERLVRAARAEGLEIALDFAIQCSPDHPWIKEHPEWFDWRPDGSIKFAENPPKKYEDIVNVHFYRDAIPGVWHALRDVVLFWITHGVRIFRVDNPHTKPVPFWEWLIRSVQERHPDVIFLSEAFTRPKMMRKLAKIGFTQSYTYFTWRHTKAELTAYLTELTQSASKEYLRPNFFVNTPDINPPHLQTGGRAAFQIRAVLAGTLSSVWGMYSGFELCEATPIPGREEYLNSEKYEIKAWDWDRPGNVRAYIARLNRIRADNPALHGLTNLRFYTAHDDNIMFYGKMTRARDNIVWVAVNLDPDNAHETGITLPLDEVGVGEDATLEVRELIEDRPVLWRGASQFIRLDPQHNPCAIWQVALHRAG
jgi:starch synthase (maltosyl-transferring)